MQIFLRKFKDKKFVTMLLALFLVFFGVFLIEKSKISASNEDMVSDFEYSSEQPVQPVKVKAEIEKVELKPCSQTDNQCKVFTVKFIEGDKSEEKVDIEYEVDQSFPIDYGVGDTVFVDILELSEDYIEYTITGVVRENSMLLLLALFILVTIIVGRLQGVGSIIGLAVSIFVLFGVVIPMLADGVNPILVGALSVLFVLTPSIFLSHGFNRKTFIAFIATLIGLGIVAILAIIFIELTKLTGLGEDESIYLILDNTNNISLKGVLFVSILVGGIGVIDDVTVNQVSAIMKIKQANPGIPRRKLLTDSLSLGQDHIASMVNTLFIAYSAASMPLIMNMVSRGISFYSIINDESFAEEIVRTLVASIGLILVVPITSFVASYIIASEKFAGLGFEPRLMDSESTVLPLDDPAAEASTSTNTRMRRNF